MRLLSRQSSRSRLPYPHNRARNSKKNRFFEHASASFRRFSSAHTFHLSCHWLLLARASATCSVLLRSIGCAYLRGGDVLPPLFRRRSRAIVAYKTPRRAEQKRDAPALSLLAPSDAVPLRLYSYPCALCAPKSKNIIQSLLMYI